MLKKLLKNKKFSKIVEDVLKERETLDMIIFGSVIRGEREPEDVDLLVLYTPDIDVIEKNYEIGEKLKGLDENFEITGKTYDELFSSEFLAREGILSEGFSLKNNKFISECFGYKSFMFFKYSLDNLNKSEKMQFYYGMNGRKSKGILEKNNGYKLSNNIILVPVKNSETIKDFLGQWEVKYTEFPITIPERIFKYKIKKNDI